MPPPFDTPLLFLIFNRPDTTGAVFEQIRKLQPARLFVAADGPRSGVEGEAERCAGARAVIESVDWPCEVHTLFRDDNMGCGPAVSSAISWFFSQVEEGIILEDDCYPDPSFFAYCRELLERYRKEERVKLIGGNNFQGGITRGGGSYYFSHYTEIWGWASWRRVWKGYDFSLQDLEATLARGVLDNIYKRGEEKAYWINKFVQTKAGKINTWDYQLTYAVVKEGGLAIIPQVNLVKNIGIQNQPTHHALYDSRMDLPLGSLPFPLVHPPLVVDRDADHYTFLQIYSKSPKRLLRLVRQNGMVNFVRYLLRKKFQKK